MLHRHVSTLVNTGYKGGIRPFVATIDSPACLEGDWLVKNICAQFATSPLDATNSYTLDL